MYRLLHDVGFTRFYDLKGTKPTPPIGSKAFQRADFTWIADEVDRIEGHHSSKDCESSFGVRGISCLGCVWLIEAVFQAQGGTQSIAIDTSRGSVRVYWNRGKFDAIRFAEELQKLGYELVPDTGGQSQSTKSSILSQRIGVCGFLLLNTMLFTLPTYLGMSSDYFLYPIFSILSAMFATFSFLIGGSYFFERTIQTLRHRALSIDFPVALGLIVAYLGSLIGWLNGASDLIYFDFVATFVFLMLCGRWLQEFALEKNQSHLNRRRPENQYVTLYGGPEDGSPKAVENVRRGDEYLVKPGEINPVSARVHNEASFSLEWINGEPDPVTWGPQQLAPAGAINVGLSAVPMTADEPWAESLLARLLAPGEAAFQSRKLQRVISVYIALVLAFALTGGAIWYFLSGSFMRSLQVLISVLIVSCPCALGIALPMTNEMCQSRLRRLGLFIRNHSIWERLRSVRTIVFDKTGTLTLDTPRLINPESFNSLDADSLHALHSLVEKNLHPKARSIRMELLLRHPHLEEEGISRSIQETVGRGVFYQSENGDRWSLGKPDWENGAPSPSPSPKNDSETALARNGDIITSFQFEEDLRDNTRRTIQRLQSMDYKVAILSGDASANVDRIAAELGIDSPWVRSRCSPDQKAAWIDEHAGKSAMMIGDGANDRLAFDQAICRGTPIVDRSILEATTDYFFFGRSLSCLPALMELARRRHRIVISIFSLAILYNLIAITLCLAGAMHPLLAAVLMPLSSIASMIIPLYGIPHETVAR